jgi:hypothetical protein
MVAKDVFANRMNLVVVAKANGRHTVIEDGFPLPRNDSEEFAEKGVV